MEPFRRLLIAFGGIAFATVIMAATISRDPVKIVETKTNTIILPTIEERFSEAKLLAFLQELNIKHYEIVFAQAVLETGHFKSKSFTIGNNLFGMKKARKRATTAIGEYLGHARYKSWKESVIDYALYQSTYLSKLKTKEQYFNYLTENYAEDKRYVELLKKIILNS